MPGASRSRWAARAATGVAALSLAAGISIAGSGGEPVTIAAPTQRPTTTSTTAAPAVVPPTTTPPTTAPPAPVTTVVTTPPTTAAPRPVAAPVPAPAYVAQTAQQRGEAALALINYPWERLGYRIEFLGAVPGYLGMTSSATRTISIYVREKQSLDSLARTIAHEIGHAVDFGFLSVAEARQYIAIRGIAATPETWFGCNGCSDYQTAAGDFAETFQYWLLGDGEFLSQMGPKPTAEQLAQLGPIFTI